MPVTEQAHTPSEQRYCHLCGKRIAKGASAHVRLDAKVNGNYVYVHGACIARHEAQP